MPELDDRIDKTKYTNWLSDTEYEKLKGQLRLQLNGVFEPFKCYGQDVFIPKTIDAIVKLTEIFGMRVRGKDKPLLLEQSIIGGPDD